VALILGGIVVKGYPFNVLLYVIASIFLFIGINGIIRRMLRKSEDINETFSSEEEVLADDRMTDSIEYGTKFSQVRYATESESNQMRINQSVGSKGNEDIQLFGQNVKESSRKEFNKIISQLLSLVKDTQFAYTAALFWVNREKQQLVLESHVTNSEKFIKFRRLPIGLDVVSQIAITGKPKVVNYVDDYGQSDMVPYYNGAELIKTFVGIPIFYDKKDEPIAVLVIDCLEADAYGEETVASLSSVSNLISNILETYTSKYDLLLDSEVLRAIGKIKEELTIDFSINSISKTLAEEVSKLVPWDYISIVLYDDNRKSWVLYYLKNRMNDAYAPLMKDLQTERSIVVEVIQAGIPKIVDDVTKLENPRFYIGEHCDSEGSLMIVPLSSFKKCYGAVVVESKDLKAYTDTDVGLVQKLAVTSAWAMEILGLTELINNHVAFDETTSVLTRKNFIRRLIEEVQRANDFSVDLALVMVSVDRMNEHIEKYGRDAFDLILQELACLIKGSVRTYDVIGRIDFNCFAILLVNTTTNEASLWAEKMRKNIASHVISINSKNLSVTVSLGVAGAKPSISDLELVENANRVLQKAIDAGGNIVRVY